MITKDHTTENQQILVLDELVMDWDDSREMKRPVSIVVVIYCGVFIP